MYLEIINFKTGSPALQAVMGEGGTAGLQPLSYCRAQSQAPVSTFTDMYLTFYLKE